MGKKRKRNLRLLKAIPRVRPDMSNHNANFSQNCGPGINPPQNEGQFSNSWLTDCNRNFNACNPNIQLNSFENFSICARPMQPPLNPGFCSPSEMQQFHNPCNMPNYQNVWNDTPNFDIGNNMVDQRPFIDPIGIRSNQDHNMKLMTDFGPAPDCPAPNNFQQERNYSLPVNFAAGVNNERFAEDFQPMHSNPSFNLEFCQDPNPFESPRPHQDFSAMSSLPAQINFETERKSSYEQEQIQNMEAKIRELNRKLWNVEQTLDAKSEKKPNNYPVEKRNSKKFKTKIVRKPYKPGLNDILNKRCSPFPENLGNEFKTNDRSFNTASKLPISCDYRPGKYAFSKEAQEPGPSHVKHFGFTGENTNISPAWPHQFNHESSMSAYFSNQNTLPPNEEREDNWSKPNYNEADRKKGILGAEGQQYNNFGHEFLSRPKQSVCDPIPEREPYRRSLLHQGNRGPLSEQELYVGRRAESTKDNQNIDRSVWGSFHEDYYWKEKSTDSELDMGDDHEDDEDLRFQLLRLKQQKIEEQLEELDRKSRETERKLSMFENKSQFPNI